MGIPTPDLCFTKATGVNANTSDYSVLRLATVEGATDSKRLPASLMAKLARLSAEQLTKLEAVIDLL